MAIIEDQGIKDSAEVMTREVMVNDFLCLAKSESNSIPVLRVLWLTMFAVRPLLLPLSMFHKLSATSSTSQIPNKVPSKEENLMDNYSNWKSKDVGVKRHEDTNTGTIPSNAIEESKGSNHLLLPSCSRLLAKTRSYNEL